MYRVFIDHKPIPKKRHRTGSWQGKKVTYDPQRTEKIKTKWWIADLFRKEGLLKPLEGPIFLRLVSYDLFPKSWSKKRVKETVEQGSWKITKGDWDNIGKFYCDVMNGIAYKDDAQIVQAWSEKKYSDKEGVLIEIGRPVSVVLKEMRESNDV